KDNKSERHTQDVIAETFTNCGEFAESYGELSKLSAIVKHYVSITYELLAERWRVIRVFLIPDHKKAAKNRNVPCRFHYVQSIYANDFSC
ncbi:MAG: hypothetical protein MJZ36_11190, partial [Bacteroidaceae bacterium]|nr:hypothetical protein [Bacteroidaceae bacterium]